MNVNVSVPTARQIAILGLALLVSVTGWAAKETALYSFLQDGSTGYEPDGGLVADMSGNLYGTTSLGGINPVDCSNGFGCGTVFELSPPLQLGGVWTETVLYEFQGGADGDRPICTPVIDKDGNLYGTSSFAQGNGIVVWELSPPSQQGGPWTQTTLYNFPGLLYDGGLLMDSAGNLYGTSYYGGSANCGLGCGTVFEVSPPKLGGGWTGTVLYSFQGGADSEYPFGTLILDNKGALYGTTAGIEGYPCPCGTVFRLVPPAEPEGAWTKYVLYSFSGADGSSPEGGLLFDRRGNLYGTTTYGGPQNCAGRQGCGNVFELSPPSQPHGVWIENVLHTFTDQNTGDGHFPQCTLIMDEHGNLYGTTGAGGRQGRGTVFELLPPGSGGGLWTEVRFPLGNNGNFDLYLPAAGLIFGPGKAVSGTATAYTGGGVFSISP
jgi:uncharacterized repeat protein (TIGR03803 family)